MSAFSRSGAPTGHYLSDYSGAPLHMNFDAPVSEERKKNLEAALSSIFKATVRVQGSLWNYDLSKAENRANVKSPIGHFRVAVAGRREHMIAAIHDVSAAEALELSYYSFQIYREKLPVVNSIRAKGKFEHTVRQGDKDYYIHFEEYCPNATWIGRGSMENRGRELGSLVGNIYAAGQTMGGLQEEALRQYTDVTARKFQLEGIEILSGGTPQDLKVDLAIDREIFKPVEPYLQKTQDVLLTAPRTPNAHNVIEKMVWIDKKSDLLVLACCSDAASGYGSMLTENATYDAGNAIMRIVLDANRYQGTDEEKTGKIVKQLSEFVAGYNESSGMSLKSDEALEAARLTYVTLTAHGLGYYVHNARHDNRPETAKDVEEHWRTTLPGIATRIDSINALEAHL